MFQPSFSNPEQLYSRFDRGYVPDPVNRPESDKQRYRRSDEDPGYAATLSSSTDDTPEQNASFQRGLQAMNDKGTRFAGQLFGINSGLESGARQIGLQAASTAQNLRHSKELSKAGQPSGLQQALGFVNAGLGALGSFSGGSSPAGSSSLQTAFSPGTNLLPNAWAFGS